MRVKRNHERNISRHQTSGIEASAPYPIVSVYEYEFLKKETEVQEAIKDASIYMILQRPLTFFDYLTAGEGYLKFDIVDGKSPPIHCELPFSIFDIADGEEVMLDIQYFRTPASSEPPFREVAAFRFLRGDGSFVVWETPQKLLYEIMVNGLQVRVVGTIDPFVEFNVHYIGQAFSQAVWKRLTGHEKLQEILTLEAPLSELTTRPPFEVSLLMLNVVGFTEFNQFPFNLPLELPAGVTPIVFQIDFEEENTTFEDYYMPRVKLDDKQLTNEVEAMQIDMFHPNYNKTKFTEYPHIKSGIRSLGYTCSNLKLSNLPAILKTTKFTMDPWAVDSGVSIDAPEVS